MIKGKICHHHLYCKTWYVNDKKSEVGMNEKNVSFVNDSTRSWSDSM